MVCTSDAVRLFLAIHPPMSRGQLCNYLLKSYVLKNSGILSGSVKGFSDIINEYLTFQKSHTLPSVMNLYLEHDSACDCVMLQCNTHKYNGNCIPPKVLGIFCFLSVSFLHPRRDFTRSNRAGG